MSVICRDLTKGKLFLAYELLALLDKNIPSAQLFLMTEGKKQYSELLKSFKNLRYSNFDLDLKESDILIDITDLEMYDINESPNKRLIFPVIYSEKSADYCSLKNKFSHLNHISFTPLAPVKDERPLITGNPLCALDMVQRLLTINDLMDKKILISAGPTAEDIDPVRFITNRSSGKMGLEIARAAYIRGADVELVVGPVGIEIPGYLNYIKVRSAMQMADAVISKFPSCDAYIAAAAVADYTPENFYVEKIKKQDNGLMLNLKRTTDILRSICKIRKKQQVVIGFSVETENSFENSRKKLIEKNLNFIVINNPKESGAGFETDTNRVNILFDNGNHLEYPLLSKFDVSNKILDQYLIYLADRQNG
ncbi:MAG: phosphopantothenoylcysteine decarboxylase [Calditrichaceae bacterium]